MSDHDNTQFGINQPYIRSVGLHARCGTIHQCCPHLDAGVAPIEVCFVLLLNLGTVSRTCSRLLLKTQTCHEHNPSIDILFLPFYKLCNHLNLHHIFCCYKIICCSCRVTGSRLASSLTKCVRNRILDGATAYVTSTTLLMMSKSIPLIKTVCPTCEPLANDCQRSTNYRLD